MRHLFGLLGDQRGLEFFGDYPGRFITSDHRVITCCHDAAQIAEIEVLHLALSRLGSVEPVSNTQLGKHLLGHLGDARLGHLRLAVGFELGVLLFDAVAHGRHALERELGNGALLFGYSCKYLLSASFARTKTLRLGPLRNLGWSFEMGTLRALGAFALVAIAATVAFGLVAVAVTWGSAVAATATVAAAWSVAVAATTVAVAIPASALGASFDHCLKRLVVRNEFEQIGAGSLLAALHD